MVHTHNNLCSKGLSTVLVREIGGAVIWWAHRNREEILCDGPLDPPDWLTNRRSERFQHARFLWVGPTFSYLPRIEMIGFFFFFFIFFFGGIFVWWAFDDLLSRSVWWYMVTSACDDSKNNIDFFNLWCSFVLLIFYLNEWLHWFLEILKRLLKIYFSWGNGKILFYLNETYFLFNNFLWYVLF